MLAQFVHLGLPDSVLVGQVLNALEAPVDFGLCLVVRLEVGVVTGQHIAALAGFGVFGGSQKLLQGLANLVRMREMILGGAECGIVALQQRSGERLGRQRQ